jgi:Tfp pilus assembly protein PilF
MTAALPPRSRPLRLAFFAGFLGLASLTRADVPTSDVGVPTAPDGTSTLFADEQIRKAIEKVNDELTDGKVDAALTDADAAIYLHPKSPELRLARAQIYVRKKLWKRAEEDCAVALKVLPHSSVVKYNLAELKFMQREYDEARPGFLQLGTDKSLGDLSIYKAYLCDLLAGNKERAQRQLDAFNAVRSKPSYFFANAAMDMVNHRQDEAAKWFDAVSHAYDARTIDPYFTALLEADSLSAPKVSFTTTDGTAYPNVPAFSEDDGLRIFQGQAWSTIPYEKLSDDLSGFPVDMRREIMERKRALAGPLSDMHQVTFTTRDGRVFDHVNAVIEAADLRVQGALGWISIPFAQLPADLSGFPDDWQKEILARDVALLPPASGADPVTFTTRSGRKFEQVRVLAGRTGLILVTSDGWQSIPFGDLPEDLSVFPDKLRQEILQSEKAAQTPLTTLAALSEGPPPPARAPVPPVWNAAGGQPPAFIQEAQDCRFGRCLALQGSRLVVGCAGATYVYENSTLQARLCPDADQTQTGDSVRSVALSGDTIVTSTAKGVYVWVDAAGNWKLQQHLEIPEAMSVAVDGDKLAVGIDGQGSGDAPVLFYLRQGGHWQPAPTLGHESSVSHSADLSGRRVALQGNEAVMGLPNWTPGSRDVVSPEFAGHAWVKSWDGATWQPGTPLAARDDGLGANQFGANVAISGDRVAIGSSNRDNNRHPHPGEVYLFHRGSVGWEPAEVLVTPGDASQGTFGAGALALSGDTLAVAEMDADASVADVILGSGDDSGKAGTIHQAGAVYVYAGGKWRVPLSAPDPVDDLDRSGSPDKFGASVALDGGNIAVGAPGRHNGQGAVYLWRRQGEKWQPAGELKGFHPDYGLTP